MLRDNSMLDVDEIHLVRDKRLDDFGALCQLVVWQAAFEAAGRVCSGSEEAYADSPTRGKYGITHAERRPIIAASARWWLLSPDEHGPARISSRGVTTHVGMSFRWICSHMGINPDAAQAAIRRDGWDAFADRCRHELDSALMISRSRR